MKRLSLTAVLLLGGVVAGCGGGGGSHTLPATGSPITSNAAVPAALQISNWGQGIMQGATYVGPVSNLNLTVTVQVHQQNAAGLVQYAQEVNDPSSPFYRKFLTPQEIGQRYGATQTNYQTVASYFTSNGINVAGWPQRLVLIASGNETQMEKAFGTTFGIYQLNGKQFVAPMTAPHFQQAMPVDAVARIAAFKPEHTFMIPGAPRAGAGYATGFSPSTVRAAFDYIGAYDAGYNGNGVTIGIIGTGAIDTQAAAPGDVDLATYAADTNTTNVATVTEHLVTNEGVAAGLSASPTPINSSEFPYAPSFAPTPGPPWGQDNEDGESQLDTQQAATLAPGSSVIFYLGYNTNDGCPGNNFASPCPTSGPNAGSVQFGIVESDAEIQQAIADNDADVISMSFGGGETQQGWTGYNSGDSPYVGSYSQLEFAALAAEGVAVFASSGDDGSAECFQGQYYLPQQCVTYPAGDPNVTSVGGITTNVDLSGAITAPWLAWGISTSDNGYGGQEGSGGGISTIFPVSLTQDPWQYTALGVSMREQPDVSLDGDPSTGVSTVVDGQLSGIGGTSVSAPEMAAMWADVLSACKQHPGTGACPVSGPGAWWRMGNASKYLYAIYSTDTSSGYAKATYKVTGWTPTMTYAQTFYDIIYGDNEMYANPGSSTPTPATPVPGFAAGTGYDEVTGVGVPFAGHLIDAILTTTAVL